MLVHDFQATHRYRTGDHWTREAKQLNHSAIRFRTEWTSRADVLGHHFQATRRQLELTCCCFSFSNSCIDFSLAPDNHVTTATPESCRTRFGRETPTAQSGKHPLREPPDLFFSGHHPDGASLSPPESAESMSPILAPDRFSLYCEFSSQQSRGGMNST